LPTQSGLQGRKDMQGPVYARWRETALCLLIFSHLQTGKGYIYDLSAFQTLGRNRHQICLRVLTPGDFRQCDHFIRGLAHLQCAPRMFILSTCFLSASLAQAAGFLLAGKVIRGRWQRTIVVVFGQALFQHVYPLDQLVNQFVSLPQLFSHRLVFGSQLDESFFWLHALEFTRSLALLQVRRKSE
jgi:hypothetical protein